MAPSNSLVHARIGPIGYTIPVLNLSRFVRSFIPSFLLPSFIHSFIHLFVRSFAHSFIPLICIHSRMQLIQWLSYPIATRTKSIQSAQSKLHPLAYQGSCVKRKKVHNGKRDQIYSSSSPPHRFTQKDH